MSNFVEYAILTDAHWPYESKAYDLAVEFLKSRDKLKRVVLGGDMLEVNSLSKHLRNPDAPRLFQEELEYANMRLDELYESLPGIEVDFVEGNHCHRFSRYVMEKAPELWGMQGLNVAALLHINERRGFRFIPYEPRQLVQVGDARLFFRHEPVGGGRTHAKATAESSMVNICYGHTHTHQSYTVRPVAPHAITVTATALPWLGNDKEWCFGYRGPKDAWQRGFTLVQSSVPTDDIVMNVILDQGIESSPRFFFEGRTYG